MLSPSSVGLICDSCLCGPVVPAVEFDQNTTVAFVKPPRVQIKKKKHYCAVLVLMTCTPVVYLVLHIPLDQGWANVLTPGLQRV